MPLMPGAQIPPPMPPVGMPGHPPGGPHFPPPGGGMYQFPSAPFMGPGGGRFQGAGRGFLSPGSANMRPPGAPKYPLPQGSGPRPPVKAPPRPQKAQKIKESKEMKVPQGPVVVRQPATEQERKEVEQWIQERKTNYPTAENIARKEAEMKHNPGFSRSRKRLQEVLARQRALGVDRIAGTTDMVDGSPLSRKRPAPFGGRGYDQQGRRGSWSRGRGGHRGGWQGRGPTSPQGGPSVSLVPYEDDEEEQDGGAKPDNQGAGPLPDAGASGTSAGPRDYVRFERPRGGKLERGGHSQGRRGRGRGMLATRGPSLLEKLLTREIHMDCQRLLECIRFIVNNDFFQRDGPLRFPEDVGPTCAVVGDLKTLVEKDVMLISELEDDEHEEEGEQEELVEEKAGGHEEVDNGVLLGRVGGGGDDDEEEEDEGDDDENDHDGDQEELVERIGGLSRFAVSGDGEEEGEKGGEGLMDVEHQGSHPN